MDPSPWITSYRCRNPHLEEGWDRGSQNPPLGLQKRLESLALRRQLLRAWSGVDGRTNQYQCKLDTHSFLFASCHWLQAHWGHANCTTNRYCTSWLKCHETNMGDVPPETTHRVPRTAVPYDGRCDHRHHRIVAAIVFPQWRPKSQLGYISFIHLTGCWFVYHAKHGDLADLRRHRQGHHQLSLCVRHV